ncbi:hypothetical protein BDV06DRAFT_221907 [Aspergillus oleicola]
MPRSLASTGSSQSDNTKTSQASSNELVPTSSLASIQHLDRHGKVIADPDRSNPTRPRLERPLETLRGFEAAINARQGGHLRE